MKRPRYFVDAILIALWVAGYAVSIHLFSILRWMETATGYRKRRAGDP